MEPSYMLAKAFPYIATDTYTKRVAMQVNLWDTLLMPPESRVPKLPPLTERIGLNLREGTSEVLEGMMVDAECSSLTTYIRLLVEREIATCRPADFARLRGVG
jgi:hypothetical protein